MLTVEGLPVSPELKETATQNVDVGANASAEVSVLLDGREMTALVDTGADYSIVSQKLADRLRKVRTPWDGPQIHTAGGHLMTPVRKCTARVRIDDSDFIGTFVILPQICRDLIIGMDFLREHDAVINIRGGFVSFSTNDTAAESTGNRHLRIVDDDVNLLPRACMLVSVKCDDRFTGDGIAEVMSTLRERGARALRARVMGAVPLISPHPTLLKCPCRPGSRPTTTYEKEKPSCK